MVIKWAQRFALFGLAVLLVAGGFFLGTSNATGYNVPVFESNAAMLRDRAADAPVTDDEQIFADIYSRVSPSVVSINVVSRVPGFSSDFFPDELEGTGTGFILDQQGHIITNYHVVEGATRIEINFFDGTITRGEVIGLDADSDLAVLTVDLPPENLQPVVFGNSDGLFIGQRTVAIGSPFGQRWTMTTGIISALERTIQGLGGYSIGAVIQTDAAINPGNSGGPLLNMSGEVIGVNSQIISRTRSNAGIGFAIPSNLTQRVAEELINNGAVNYSYLGISTRPNDVDLALMEALSLPNNLRGVVVENVEPNGPAAIAGLQNSGTRTSVDGIDVPSSADIITAIDGTPIIGFSSLIAYLAGNTRPGDTVTLTIMRGGQEMQLPVTLGERPTR